MSKHTIIIGDIHGSLDALINTLMSVGAIHRDGTKNKDWRVVSVGDMCNMAPYGQAYRGFVSEDLETLEYAMQVVDDMVIGNHELHFVNMAYIRTQVCENDYERAMAQDPMLGTVSIWHGMAMRDADLQDGMLDAFERAVKKGLYKPAVEVDGMLVTHAGLHKYWVTHSGFSHDNPVEVAREINEAYDARMRGEKHHEEILDHPDGIFWLRPEPYGAWKFGHGTPYVQVCGHTPDFKNPQFHDHLNAWIIDTGGYLPPPRNKKMTDIEYLDLCDAYVPKVGAIVKRDGDSEYTAVG